MKRPTFKACAAALLISGIAQAAYADVPTVADLKSMLAQGQFQNAILGANQLLDLSGDARAAVDRHAVLTIKAEAQLQVHAYSAAADAFSAAAKTQTPNPKTTAVDLATVELIHRSNDGAYTPKSGALAAGFSESPIEILSKNGRGSAFQALFDDELATDKSKFASATSEQNLPALLHALKTAQSLDNLEIAASGKDEQTHQQTETLSTRGHDLISSALQNIDSRINRIAASAAANEQRSQRMMGFGGPGGRGMGGYGSLNATANQSPQAQGQAALGSYNISQLNDMISQIRQLSQAIDAFGKLSDDNSKWTSLTSQADRVTSHAQDVLNGNFAAQGSSGGGPPSNGSGF